APPCLAPPTPGAHSHSPAVTGWTRPVLVTSPPQAVDLFFRRLGGDGLVNAVAPMLPPPLRPRVPPSARAGRAEVGTPKRTAQDSSSSMNFIVGRAGASL